MDTLLLTGTPGQTPRQQPLSQTYENKQITQAHTHTCNSIVTQTLIYFITHSHTGRALCTSTQSGSESAAGKIQKGKLVEDTDWKIFRKIKHRRFSTSKPMTRDKHKDRDTDTRLESKPIWASSASLPFPDFDLYYLFFFLF